MNYKIAVIPGDGIGPEIVAQAREVLDAAGKKFGFQLDYTELLWAGRRSTYTGCRSRTRRSRRQG